MFTNRDIQTVLPRLKFFSKASGGNFFYVEESLIKEICNPLSVSGCSLSENAQKTLKSD